MKTETTNNAKDKLTLKKYSPPALIMYGKLTEITTSGTQGVPEAGAASKNKKTYSSIYLISKKQN